jgi:hypothetical protein
LIILNYTSGKSSSGTCAHNHTTIWCNRPYTAGLIALRQQYSPTITPIIPETEYFATGIGYQLTLQTSSGNAQFSYAFQGEVQSTEPAGAGWLDFYDAFYVTDAEIGPSINWARARDDFKRWPADSADRLDVEVVRDYRFDTTLNNAGLIQVQKFVTYHSMLFPIEGTISGSAGGTVSITAYRASDGTVLGSTSRTGNGTYSITWYDDIDDVIVVAEETSELRGISKEDVAGTGGFDISLSSATYYAYS